MVLKYTLGFLDTWVCLMVHDRRRCKVAIQDGPAWSLITGNIKLLQKNSTCCNLSLDSHSGLRNNIRKWPLLLKPLIYSLTYGPPPCQGSVGETPQGQKGYEMVLSVNRVWSGICLEAPVMGMPSVRLVKDLVNWLQFNIVKNQKPISHFPFWESCCKTTVTCCVLRALWISKWWLLLKDGHSLHA